MQENEKKKDKATKGKKKWKKITQKNHYGIYF